MTLLTDSEGSTSSVAIPGAPVTATTAFAPNGTELPLSGVVIVVTPDGGEPLRPQIQRFTAGHVAANTALDAGAYVVDIVVTTRDGRSYESSWPLAIAPAPAG